MKTRPFSLFPSWKRSSPVSEPGVSSSITKVSLHWLINQLLKGLQPQAMQRDNIILNGVPEGLSFLADENSLAARLRALISNALNGRRNECIHIIALVSDDQTMICARGTNISVSISNNFLTV